MNAPALGLRENRRQFALLVVINAFVGAMVGIERSVLPPLARDAFGITSASVVLSFLVAFGAVKAVANLAAGGLADRIGRRPLLIAGWLAALPVAPMIVFAPSWGWIVAANLLLGLNQGLAWSATVIMKTDLAGPHRRGLAMGVNEVAGYAAVAVAAWAAGTLAGAYGPRPAPFVLGAAIAVSGLVLSVGWARDTTAHARVEAGCAWAPARFSATFRRTVIGDRTLSAVSQAGFVNNLNDGMAWGLLPLYLAANGLPIAAIGLVVGVYPAVWSVLQVATGAWSDRIGRKRPIVAGMAVQAAAIAALVVADSFAWWLLASVALGVGTALAYPTLLAAIGDRADPDRRASALGSYRFVRDLGYVAGALISGVIADALGMTEAILAVAALTLASGLVAAVRMDETLPALGTAAPAAPATVAPGRPGLPGSA